MCARGAICVNDSAAALSMADETMYAPVCSSRYFYACAAARDPALNSTCGQARGSRPAKSDLVRSFIISNGQVKKIALLDAGAYVPKSRVGQSAAPLCPETESGIGMSLGTRVWQFCVIVGHPKK